MRFSPHSAMAVLEGRKCCASWREREAMPGDEFEVGGVRYRVLEVFPMQIHRLIFEFYRCEGFATWSDCLAGLETAFPGMRPAMPVWVHFFARCP